MPNTDSCIGQRVAVRAPGKVSWGMHGSDPALLTIAWAAGAGLLAQVLGTRWRIPPIVFLLFTGLLLGPSVLGVVHPAALGGGLSVLVKLAVAIILFDGALSLRLGDLRRAAHEVRSLVTVGVLVTWAGALLAAHFIAGLSWPVALIFSALMTVTGPTVVQPLLKRVQIPRLVRTTLEGEAILIDPIGAVLAVAVMDAMLGLAGVVPLGFVGGVWGYFGRLIVGLLVGVVGGVVLSWVLRSRWVPGDLVNLVVLAGAWVVFATAEATLAESGIMAAVTLGLVLQRGAVPQEHRLRRFKEQITLLGISLVFVLLAANLPISVVLAEGWRGMLTVLTLMWVVRPLSVFIALRRSALSVREKLFVSWVGPRGIVAASVASLFALTLTNAGFSEGPRLLAISFLTIATTVTVQGLTANLVARLLGLQSVAGRGVLIVGAGPLGRGIAQLLREHGRPVVLVDRNEGWAEEARAQGFEVISGNALDEEVLARAGAEDAETVLALTTNSEANALAAHLAQDAFGVSRALPAVGAPGSGAGAELLDRVGGSMAFGRPVDLREWDVELARGRARFLAVKLPPDWKAQRVRELPVSGDYLPIARVKGTSVEIASGEQRWEPGDTAVVLTARGEAEVLDRLRAAAPLVTA